MFHSMELRNDYLMTVYSWLFLRTGFMLNILFLLLFPDGFDVCYKAPTIPTAQDDKSESDESESVSSEEGQGKPKLSWVHIIRYNTYLTRLLNMCPLLGRTYFTF